MSKSDKTKAASQRSSVAETITGTPTDEAVTPENAAIVTDEQGNEHVGELNADSADEDTQPTDPDPRAEARVATLARANEPTDGELVASRSADTDKTSTDEHIKTFVLPPGPKPTKANGFEHEPNFAAVRQYMLSQGLRPAGDVRHVSTEAFGPGGESWAITYAVPAVPAERFDFAEVHVITENEDPDGDGVVTGEATKPTA